MNEDPPEAPRAANGLIRNCRFAFLCAQQWDTLSATEHPGRRYCRACERRVVLCETEDELHAALRRNDCVAIPATLLEFGSEAGRNMRYFRGSVGQSRGD